jgi:hypothetical protein
LPLPCIQFKRALPSGGWMSRREKRPPCTRIRQMNVVVINGELIDLSLRLFCSSSSR